MVETGAVPVRMEVIAYTKGRGKISLTLDGYFPCHNAEEVIAQTQYDPEADLEHTPDSVFCSHGAGHTVKWNEVEQHMHLPLSFSPQTQEEDVPTQTISRRVTPSYGSSQELDKELQKIFERTYGSIQPRAFRSPRAMRYDHPREVLRQLEPATDFLLVDGYNIIFAWDDLKALAADNLDAARQALMDTLCNYQAYRRCELILVFDAYRVPGKSGLVNSYHNIHVVYTKEAETADMFIEKVSYEINGRRNVRVATSDGLEQIIILAHGAQRISARAFRDEVEQVNRQIQSVIQEQNRR